jgi:predicted Ser/Thr protein kinase
MSNDETRLGTSNSGWLSSSGSIDHGRFAPGMLVDNRYRVIGLVGRGGMGEVYRADDLRLGQPVALKFLPEALAHDARRLAQFHNEVRTARQVSHANVCRVYDIGELNGQMFLTMEYVDGEDLSSLLRRIGRLPEERAVEIARQICAGLSAAHERGVLHRDLKPANIMLDGAGRVRIMDFSLAAVGKVEDIRAGTPAYMAPEQLDGREVTVRSDIYSLGLVLYEVFTGRRAFDAKTIADLVAQHQSGTITSPTQLVSALDPVVDRAIMRCLDSDPSRRPASALAVAASLPGGDPLAAALAAGETPSPEMVAAAGGEHAAVSPRAGMAWIGIMLASLITLGALSDKVSAPARMPLRISAAALADRADQFRQSFGYTESVVDSKYGMRFDPDFLNWAALRGEGQRGWKILEKNSPTSLFLWYRTSPIAMVPLDDGGPIGLSDPPLMLAGMTMTRVDTEGRLRLFEAVPMQREQGNGAGGSAQDSQAVWSKLFQAAGFDQARFTEVAPQWTPRTFADERKAWTGTLDDGGGLPIRVEAAVYRGRPVMFDVIGEWTRAARQDFPKETQTARLTSVLGNLVLWGLLAGTAILAHRHVRSGRADRNGAFNLGTAVFLTTMAGWAVAGHVSNASAEFNRFIQGVAISLFQSAFLYLAYLALEPFVRRLWPTNIITWTRLMSGRVRDPLVGRDLLIGTTIGCAITAVTLLYNFVPPMLGQPEPMPNLGGSAVGALAGSRNLIAQVFQQVGWSLQNSMLFVMLFATLRHAMRSVRFGRAIAFLICVVIFSITSSRSNQFESGYVWFDIAFNAMVISVFLVIIQKFGLFASTVMFFVNAVVNSFLITFDSSRLYADQSWALLILITGMALTGLWLARAGEPLFGKQTAN